MDKEIKDKILSLDSNLNSKGLIDFIESSNIEIKSVNLKSGIAITVPDLIYIDLLVFETCYGEGYDFMFYFIVLHEISHYKRLANKKVDLNYLDRLVLFRLYADIVIYEEILSDRYASVLFYYFNKELFPSSFTQKLHIKSHQDVYSGRLFKFWNFMKDNKLNYADAFKSLIIEKKEE